MPPSKRKQKKKLLQEKTLPLMHKRLSESLLQNGLCSSGEEADIISDDIMVNIQDEMNAESATLLQHNVMDYFDLTTQQANDIVRNVFPNMNGDLFVPENSLSEEEETKEEEEEMDSDNDENDEDEYITEGECELCERYMKTTLHHLVPKSTWPKLKKKVFKSKHNSNIRIEALIFLASLKAVDPNEHVDTNNTTFEQEWTRSSLHFFLCHYTCRVCRPCHSVIHKTHDNVSLAEHYNTVVKLLADRDIYKFCKWASKQKAGKYKH